jgi:riboflavin synthase
MGKKKARRAVRVGVVDTMFARYDMGAAARDELSRCPGHGERFEVVARTVPGFKDLAVAAKVLIEREGCAIVVALGMPGSAPIDKQCAHEASTGLMSAQLMTSTPILEVFVHEDETDDPAELASLFENRSRAHARNAYWMLFEPEQLARRAGQGVRQGFADAGPLSGAGPAPR